MSAQLPSWMHETIVRLAGDLRPGLRGSKGRSTSALLGPDLGFIGDSVNGGPEAFDVFDTRPHPRESEDSGVEPRGQESEPALALARRSWNSTAVRPAQFATSSSIAAAAEQN